VVDNVRLLLTSAEKMAKKTERTNPFYVLLVVVGTAFVLTVFAYGLMTYQSMQPRLASLHGGSNHPLWQLMRERGNAMLVVELSLLAVLTVAAIGTDSLWSRSRKPQSDESRNPAAMPDTKSP
jgi:flagellar basal body-associated protein FliL